MYGKVTAWDPIFKNLRGGPQQPQGEWHCDTLERRARLLKMLRLTAGHHTLQSDGTVLLVS